MSVRLIEDDCLAALPSIPDGTVDAVVTDPPYGLSFMGKDWDHGIPGVPFWEAIFRTLKPGGYATIFGGTRTYHRLACAVEDAGFEIRDCLMWLYGSGFPKGEGCLKPAWEPVLLCRRPGRVLPLGIDECRIPLATGEVISVGHTNPGGTKHPGWARPWMQDKEKVEATKSRAIDKANAEGRYPANVVHDGSDEVLEAFAAFGERATSKPGTMDCGRSKRNAMNASRDGSLCKPRECPAYGDAGTAARFYYCAKASKAERGEDNTHPTVKPLALMRWLVRLICPSGGTVLDPFAGSGTTALACLHEGRDCILIEKEPPHCDIIRKRLAECELPLFPQQKEHP